MNREQAKRYLEGVPPTEPVFIIRGQDILSSDTVLFWADRASKVGVDPVKVNDAGKTASAMMDWSKKKIPD